MSIFQIFSVNIMLIKCFLSVSRTHASLNGLNIVSFMKDSLQDETVAENRVSL